MVKQSKAILQSSMKGNLIHSSFKPKRRFSIGNFCIIEENVIIGSDTKIENYVQIKSNTRIGHHVFIDSYVRFSGHCQIGNHCTIRYGATIARNVLISNNVFISPNVMTIYTQHYDHDTVKPLVIMANAYIGTAAVIGPQITIGKDVIIGACSYVNRDCMEGTWAGVPVKRIK